MSCLCLTPAWADGTITHLSGKISVQKADGTILPAAVGTKVGESDTMITGTNAYARLEMTDGGEIVLRPNSRLKVESYRFNADKPAEDKFSFSMLKGGLRTVTGLIGKRGDKDAYEGKTATATVGIRGTQYDMRLCQGDCGALADGTYFAVRFGAVRTGNAQGSMDVAAGQVVLVQQAKPPVLLPRDPGIGFTPPAVIPKLDEKKKVKAAAEAAQPAQEKPEAGDPEKSSPSNTEGGEKQDQEKEQKQ
ncbi:MAG: FecR domain-containing protein, partial [Gallionella sp.]|nr:FecR domain-containing protein [Gallionella sp.]